MMACADLYRQIPRAGSDIWNLWACVTPVIRGDVCGCDGLCGHAIQNHLPCVLAKTAPNVLRTLETLLVPSQLHAVHAHRPIAASAHKTPYGPIQGLHGGPIH